MRKTTHKKKGKAFSKVKFRNGGKGANEWQGHVTGACGLFYSWAEIVISFALLCFSFLIDPLTCSTKILRPAKGKYVL